MQMLTSRRAELRRLNRNRLSASTLERIRTESETRPRLEADISISRYESEIQETFRQQARRARLLALGRA